MTMHEHDLDIIMALAEGALDPHSAAAEEVAACAQCSEDLEFQRTALGATGEAPRVYLTAVESSQLRHAVRSRLNLQTEGGGSPAPTKRRRLRLGALVGAAAVLLAVVIAGPALNLFGGSGETGDTQNVALAPEAADLATAAPTPAPTQAPRGLTGISPAPAPAATPAPAMAEIAPTEAADTADASAEFVGQLDLDVLRQGLIGRGDKTVEDVLATAAFRVIQPEPAADPAPTSTGLLLRVLCDLESVAVPYASSPSTILAFTEFEGREAVLVLYQGPSDEAPSLALLDAATCELLLSA